MTELESRNFPDHAPLSEEEAELSLPKNPLALRRFRDHRLCGHSPGAALMLTLDEWLELCRSFAYVPGRGPAR